MNRQFAVGAALLVVAAWAGIAFQDRHWRLDRTNLPADQQVIAHRDSPYTGMTWVASRSNNFLQLRFFEMVEGGVCLSPSWADLAADPRLAHLKPASPPPPAADGIDPGTLNNSAYISLFPAGILLNRSVPAAPRVLVVGLGSGVGLAQIAHHFPQAAIEVVDIDPAVIAMVRAHYPLLAWLETQRNAAGEPRLAFVDRDARAHIRDSSGRGFSLIVLDAYTAGSTIPPHLMTREFFGECAAALSDGGVVFANVIGCYGEPDAGGGLKGAKHRVVGGALRSFRAAGLEHAWVVPVLGGSESPATFDRSHSRNNILLAAKHPISPRGAAAAWDRLKSWVPFPELETGRHVTRQYQLIDRAGNTASTFVPAGWVDEAHPALAGRMRELALADGAPGHTRGAILEDSQACADAAAVVRKRGAGGQLHGWDAQTGNLQLYRRTIDWVLFPRETWRASIAFARDPRNDPESLVGPVDGPDRDDAMPTWHIVDAPLFTDQRPNADIVNR